jgi:hypothetical protein
MAKGSIASVDNSIEERVGDEPKQTVDRRAQKKHQHGKQGEKNII